MAAERTIVEEGAGASGSAKTMLPDASYVTVTTYTLAELLDGAALTTILPGSSSG